MRKTAFVMSGQGAQKAGMGQSFYDNSKAVRELYNKAEALRSGTVNQCFYGTDEELTHTENTQPCLYLTDFAAASYCAEIGIVPNVLAGFSLGEIPALAYAGAFTFEDGFKIACIRGTEMSKSAPAKMAAVLKLNAETVQDILKDIEGAWAVNFNSPEQTVISCVEDKFSEATEKLKSASARIVPLKTGGGFHSPLMYEASEKLRNALEMFSVSMPITAVYSNRTALPYCENPKSELPLQMRSPVLWSELIQNMARDGFDTFIETGTGSTLANLIRRILPNADVYTVSNVNDAETVLKDLENVKR